MNNPIPSDLIRITKFAQRIGVSCSTVHRWRLKQRQRSGRGPLPAVQIAGHWMISESAAAAWLGLNEQQAPPTRSSPSQREARIRRAERAAAKAGL